MHVDLRRRYANVGRGVLGTATSGRRDGGKAWSGGSDGDDEARGCAVQHSDPFPGCAKPANETRCDRLAAGRSSIKGGGRSGSSSALADIAWPARGTRSTAVGRF